MADDNYEFGTMDTEMQKSTYQGVMDFSVKWGVPGSMGLAAFFTCLVMALGIFPAIGAFLVSFIITRFIGVTFFTH